jgi:hypothetical protein
MTMNQRKLERLRLGRIQVAEYILQDVAKHGGEEALLVQQARRVLRGDDTSIVAKLRVRAGLGQSERKGAA